MKLYTIICDEFEAGEETFATLKEARAAWDDDLSEDGMAELLACTVSPSLRGKALLVALANGRGWMEGSVTIARRGL